MRRLCCAVLVLLLLPSVAGAVAHVGTDTSATSQSTASLSWSKTVPAGTNRMLIVGVATIEDAAPTSVTFNTTSTLTRCASGAVGPGNQYRAELYFLIDPPAVTANVVVAFGGSQHVAAGAVSYDSVAPANPCSSLVTATGVSIGPGVTVPTGISDLAVDVVACGSASTATVGPGQTERLQASEGQFFTRVMMSDESGPGSVLMSWSVPATCGWASLGISLANASGGGAPDTTPPTDPTGLVATPTGTTTVSLAWTACTDDRIVQNSRVERCSGFNCAPSVEIAQPTTNSYADSGLAQDTFYGYRVRCWDGTNFSGYSNTAQAQTTGIQQATLHWSDLATTEDGYAIRRCTTTIASCVPSVVYATVTANAVTYVDPISVKPVSCYDVQATLGGTGGSAFSNIACTSAASAILSVAPPSLVFAATVGGANPASQTITVTNSTATSMPWTAAKDQAWVASLVPSSGTNTTQITVNVSIAALSAGTFLANVTVSAPGATGTPQVIPVTLNLSPASTPATSQGGRVR